MTIVNIIGAGRVGRTFLTLLGPAVEEVASATRASAEAAVAHSGHGRVADLDAMSAADVWLLSVPDSRIAAAAQALADSGAPPAVAVHCSGFHTADVMAPLRVKGWKLASAHPMLSFADPEVSAARFPGTWVGIEGDEEAVEVIEPFFGSMGARTFRIASEAKVLYHAAAVITNNFTTVLQGIALEAWGAAGVPEEVARALNASLLKSTLENVERFGPAEALTGPAARGDRDVVEMQGRAVAEWHPEAGEVYRLLSLLADRLKTTGTTRTGHAEESPP